MTKKGKQSEQKDAKNVDRDVDTTATHRRPSLELKSLLSPEKALYLLYNLVDRNPNLWHELHQLLHPINPSTTSNSLCVSSSSSIHHHHHNNNNNNNNNNCNELESEHDDHEQIVIEHVLRNLRDLQLSQLATDTLSVIISFLDLTDCLRFRETSTFFNELIPKYLDAISLDQIHSIHQSMYSLFFKCQRLRYLSIDGTSKYNHHEHPLLFLFPFDKFRNLRQLILININFVNQAPNQFAFNGGTYSLCDLQLISCQDMDCEVWTKLTSKRHCPNLTTLAVRNCTTYGRRVEPDQFIRNVVSSRNHSQIRNLTLTIYDAQIVRLLRKNRSLMHNLHKFELGLMDKRRSNDLRYDEEPTDLIDISEIFRQLFSNYKSDGELDTNNKNNNNNNCKSHTLHHFRNLQILLIDFCPLPHARGYEDITPSDLNEFGLHLPETFPSLKLLGLYGSHSPLLFNDDHLRGFLRNKCLTQIIDLSLGFEDLSIRYQLQLQRDTDVQQVHKREHNFVQQILNTFPNLAWLTLENYQFLNESDAFHRLANEIKTTDIKLQWITLCASEKDEIYELNNGLFVEYWDRGIEQCDFDAALLRSQQIIDMHGKMLTLHQKAKLQNTACCTCVPCKHVKITTLND